MPRIPGTTDAQTKFLRSFRESSFGPGVENWPSIAILRRWLRKPGFVNAMNSLQVALRAQSDFQLLSTAAAASHILHTTITGRDIDESHKGVKVMSDLLKLAHTRERFASSHSLPKPRLSESRIKSILARCHPSLGAREALELFAKLERAHDKEDEKRAA